MPNPYAPYAEAICAIAREAGAAIMEYYEEKIAVETKADNSPVTAADLAGNAIIVARLKALTPQIPVVSEEEAEATNVAAARSDYFWLVDPLDGTKDFIKKTGQFTVNIALIEQGIPIGGVVYVPAKGESYYTGADGKAYVEKPGEGVSAICVRAVPAEGAVVVASKSHSTPETDAYIATLPKVQARVSAASSLKFCLVAEGKADIYPRFGRTMEWDTAAGHAVVLAAGGQVLKEDGAPLTYGKAGLDNPYFIVSAKR